jgi:5-methylcytosine-specific restriction protein A
MPWQGHNSQYDTAAYRRNRKLALGRAGHRCEQCGAAGRLHCDHIIPLSRGGTDDLGNLRIMCPACHGAKTAGEGGGSRARDPEPRIPRTSW